nr:MAG TPA: hypothetical protein [Inoviridae sp.]
MVTSYQNYQTGNSLVPSIKILNKKVKFISPML